MGNNLSRTKGFGKKGQTFHGQSVWSYKRKHVFFSFMLLAVIAGSAAYSHQNAFATPPYDANYTAELDRNYSIFSRRQTHTARTLTVRALQLIEEGRWEDGENFITQSKDPLAAKIYHWLLLGNTEDGGWNNRLFMRLSQFIRHNPEWPGVKEMKARAEEVMPDTLSNNEVLVWYEEFSPQSFEGMTRYVQALIVDGQHERAKEILAHWWAGSDISRAQQKQIVSNYKDYLTHEAHKKRCDALLYKGDYGNALALADLIGGGYPALAKARMALAQNKNTGHAVRIGRIPKDLLNDPGLLFERLRWRRKRDLDHGALEILDKTPPAEYVQNKEQWWKERHIMIRRLLERGQYQKAYELAAAHIQEDGFAYAQAQWVAGWLALRLIHRPTEAYERFRALYARVITPVSKSRAAYWAGRASEDMGQSVMAQGWYKKAAEYKTTFYGQMAAAALSIENKLPPRRLPALSDSQRQNYERSELIQAADIFKEAGQKKRYESFIEAFLKKDSSPKAYRFVAERIAEQGDRPLAIKFAKTAMEKGYFLTKQSYPTITKHLKNIQDAEWALIHAIIRQESMFDVNARSFAGALGLMQIMPSTAKHIAKATKVSYRKKWLTFNPQYNLKLGSWYIGELVQRYDGSYPLAIAAYNAGPSRVYEWLQVFGDPRKGQVDMVDWIELIPIYETRNYIQRVMESLYIYRLRLKHIQRKPEFPLHADIYNTK
ncbi:MAG: lytic transglycosylase domain-containing protein [Alphaproteobacteria bacterium]